jgi:hypothetical protein
MFECSSVVVVVVVVVVDVSVSVVGSMSSKVDSSSRPFTPRLVVAYEMRITSGRKRRVCSNMANRKFDFQFNSEISMRVSSFNLSSYCS